MSSQSSSRPLQIEELLDGALLRVTIDHPVGNLIDAQVTTALTGVFKSLERDRSVKAVVLCGAGDHFSFGASVEEHRPDQVKDMLARFHQLFRQIGRSGVVLLSAVRGLCLGGGLELVAFSQRVFARPDSELGQPEIALGVFAPVGSLFLRDRVGPAGADDLLLSGRRVAGEEALGMGLVDDLAEEPEQAAIEWATANLSQHSTSSLRLATRAARFETMQRFRTHIAGIEKLYMGELMKTPDAIEGIEAFLEKRPPRWEA